MLADVRWYFSFIISFAKILYSHLTSENLFFSTSLEVSCYDATGSHAENLHPDVLWNIFKLLVCLRDLHCGNVWHNVKEAAKYFNEISIVLLNMGTWVHSFRLSNICKHILVKSSYCLNIGRLFFLCLFKNSVFSFFSLVLCKRYVVISIFMAFNNAERCWIRDKAQKLLLSCKPGGDL